MNIFVLDKDPYKAARMHCDKHVVKMIVETAQMLSTAHHFWNSIESRFVYRSTHKNHPCTRWVMASEANYKWTVKLLRALLDEYTHRYGKVHKTERIYKFLERLPFDFMPEKMTTFPQAMPDKYKCDDVVKAYRNYYIGTKTKFARWTKVEMPNWFIV